MKTLRFVGIYQSLTLLIQTISRGEFDSLRGKRHAQTLRLQTR